MRPKNPVIVRFQLLTVNAKHLGFHWRLASTWLPEIKEYPLEPSLIDFLLSLKERQERQRQQD